MAAFQLSDALLLGYPPIPLTNEPVLIAARAEINAVVDIRSSRHPHFILSAMPRGGFSGGLAVHEGDFAIGVVTQGLLRNGSPEELGFLAVLTVEPIYVALSAAKLLPECQKVDWEDFWNTSSTDIVLPMEEVVPAGQFIHWSFGFSGGRNYASILHIKAYDDGRRYYLDFARSPDAEPYAELIDKAESAASDGLKPFMAIREHRERSVRLTIGDAGPAASTRLEAARVAAATVMIEAGFQVLFNAAPGCEDN